MRNRLIMITRAIVAVGLSSTAAVHAGQLPNLLTINPGVLEFSPTGVGATSSGYYSVSISNPSTTAVTITEITTAGPHASDFTITTNECPISPGTLYPGGYCYLYLSFTPSAVGLRTANILVKDVGGAPQTVLLTGEGLAATKIVSFTIPVVTFPSVPVGLPAQNAPSAYVYVENTGTAAVNIQSVAVVGADAGDFPITYNACSAVTLPSGTSCYVYLSFVPTAIGNLRAKLEAVDDAQGGTQYLPLTGVGSPPVNALQFFPTAVAFAPTGTANNESTQITVQNTGSEPVTINGFVVTGQNAPDFTLVQNSCQPIPYILSAQYECYLDVQFTPGSPGIRLANLEVVDSAPGSPQVVPMEGAGAATAVTLSFNPGPFSFGSETVGFSSYGNTNLENLSSGAAQISFQVKGANAADFSVTNECAYLGPNATCFVPIEFTPSAPGVRIATLVATDTISGQSLATALTGSGVPSGALVGAGGVVIPAALVGNTSQGTVTIYVETSPVTMTQFTLAGSAKSDFGILQNGCASGPVYGYCSIQLSFTPSVAGTRIAELNITYAGNGSPLSVPLAALGLSPAWTIAFSASPLDFGPQPVGASNGATATIENIGSEAVSITSVSLAGPDAKDYAITENYCPHSPATLAPGATCQVSMQFTPSATGTRLARMQVSDNASGSPQNLSLVGFGSDTGPVLYISPTSLNFGSLPLGTSVQQSIYLSVYSGSVSLSGLQVVGPNASDFVMTNNCVTPVYSCDVYITFTPSVTGLRVADLEIQDNATGSPQIVPLAGLGIKPTPPAPSVAFSPVPLAFPQPQGVGYTGFASITVSNPGTANLLLTGFHIAGRNAGDFGIQSNSCPLSPAPLPPSQSCYVNIAFTPSAAGIRLATFGVTDNASGSPQSTSLVGKGVAAVKTLEVNPTSIVFTPTPVGTTDFDGGYVNITNTGTVPVTFRSFTLEGANSTDFSISSNYCTYNSLELNPGTACQIYLSFTPSATGTRTGDLSISSDATGSPQTVSLSGVGQ